jgi:hypothetical protein
MGIPEIADRKIYGRSVQEGVLRATSELRLLGTSYILFDRVV